MGRRQRLVSSGKSLHEWVTQELERISPSGRQAQLQAEIDRITALAQAIWDMGLELPPDLRSDVWQDMLNEQSPEMKDTARMRAFQRANPAVQASMEQAAQAIWDLGLELTDEDLAVLRLPDEPLPPEAQK